MTFPEIQQLLNGKRVGIAGCGGLGSNCAMALARVGVGTLVIADFDIVAKSNMNRQYYFRDQIGCKKVDALLQNILSANPSVHVEAHDVVLDRNNLPVIFRECDAIVEAFDKADQKLMIIETVQETMPEVPLVTGVGVAGWGMNCNLHVRRSGNLYICGDEETEVSEEIPPLAPRVGIVACMEANVVMEVLINGEKAK